MQTPASLFRQRALTLIELLTTLSMLGILLSVGFPAYQRIIARNQLAAAVNHVTTYLHYARSEAVTRNERVVICPTSDGGTCTDSFYWNDGWMVFVDIDQDDAFTPNIDVFLRFAAIEYESLFLQTSSGRRLIRYRPDGSVLFSNATFRFCDLETDQPNRALIISNQGRPRVSDTDANGANITCVPGS